MARKMIAAAPAAAKVAAKKKVPSPAQDKLSAIGIDAICERIEAGESIIGVATGIGVSHAVLRDWFEADPLRSARARSARQRAAEAHVSEARQLLTSAGDPFELAKAKELAHHLRWCASKANPREYGDKIDVTAAVTIKDVSEEELRAKAVKLIAIAGISPDTAT